MALSANRGRRHLEALDLGLGRVVIRLPTPDPRRFTHSEQHGSIGRCEWGTRLAGTAQRNGDAAACILKTALARLTAAPHTGPIPPTHTAPASPSLTTAPWGPCWRWRCAGAAARSPCPPCARVDSEPSRSRLRIGCAGAADRSPGPPCYPSFTPSSHSCRSAAPQACRCLEAKAAARNGKLMHGHPAHRAGARLPPSGAAKHLHRSGCKTCSCPTPNPDIPKKRSVRGVDTRLPDGAQAQNGGLESVGLSRTGKAGSDPLKMGECKERRGMSKGQTAVFIEISTEAGIQVCRSNHAMPRVRVRSRLRLGTRAVPPPL